MGDKMRGLYNKFVVTRIDGSSGYSMKHEDCEYFVLDMSHDPYASVALDAYATACKNEYPLLARDLFTWLNRVKM